MFSVFDNDDSNVHLYLKTQRDWQLQLRGDVDGRRWNNNRYGRVDTFRHRNCNRDRDLNTRPRQVWLSERYGYLASDDYVGRRFL